MSPKPKAEPHHVESVERILHSAGAQHLRARKYGAAVIVESGPHDAPIKHLRVTRDTVHLWRLDFANHREKWETTPFRGELKELLQTVIENFGWTIAPFGE